METPSQQAGKGASKLEGRTTRKQTGGLKGGRLEAGKGKRLPQS